MLMSLNKLLMQVCPLDLNYTCIKLGACLEDEIALPLESQRSPKCRRYLTTANGAEADTNPTLSLCPESVYTAAPKYTSVGAAAVQENC